MCEETSALRALTEFIIGLDDELVKLCGLPGKAVVSIREGTPGALDNFLAAKSPVENSHCIEMRFPEGTDLDCSFLQTFQRAVHAC